MTTFLLDANVLLAFHDPWHVHHALARRWFISEAQQSWATCPLTENAFVRIASHPSYPDRPADVHELLSVLRRLRSEPGHTFWPDDISIADLLLPDTVVAHSHITDLYLIGLAVKRGGKLATLDGRIPIGAVRGGREAIELLTE